MTDDAVMLGAVAVPLVVRTEVIRVRQPDGTFSDETRQIREVLGLGVIAPDEALPIPPALVGADAVLVAWPGMGASTELFMYLDFARAQDLSGGSDDATQLWSGHFLDASHGVRHDGARPFIATANNDPWGRTDDNDPTNDAFYYGSF